MIIKKSFPKISCLLLTYPVHGQDRFESLKKSVYSYLAQIYPNRELVILNEGPKDYQERIYKTVKELNRPDIRCEFLNAEKGDYTLGGLRNISIGLAHGEIFVQWDDDDYCTPERLTAQYQYLQNSKAIACFLTDQLHYFCNRKELYWNNWLIQSGGHKKYSLIPGTIMSWKTLDLRYPHLPRFEDTVMTDELSVRNGGEDIALLSGHGYMHVYTFHGGNLWEENHHRGIIHHRSNDVQIVAEYQSVISRTLRFLDLADSIKVMGRGGKVAFVYQKD